METSASYVVNTAKPPKEVLTPRAESDSIHSERHTCGRLLIIVRPMGLQMKCPKCGEEVLYTWRKILTMQLMAWG